MPWELKAQWIVGQSRGDLSEQIEGGSRLSAAENATLEARCRWLTGSSCHQCARNHSRELQYVSTEQRGCYFPVPAWWTLDFRGRREGSRPHVHQMLSNAEPRCTGSPRATNSFSVLSTLITALSLDAFPRQETHRRFSSAVYMPSCYLLRACYSLPECHMRRTQLAKMLLFNQNRLLFHLCIKT